MLNSASMKFARTHRSLIAWMLYGFILLNGLACSMCHGQMLGAFSNGSEEAACAMGHSSSHPASMTDMGHLPSTTKSMTSDCSFAAIMALAMIFFIVLGLLIRVSESRPAPPESFRKKPPRYLFPGLNPQAP